MAQKSIASHLDSSTMVLDHSSPGMVTGVMNNIRNIVPNINNQVDDRLMKIEALMKQKASGRHYIMLAFYILSLVALKLDDKYSVMALLFSQQETAEAANVRASGNQKSINRNSQVHQKRTAANTTPVKSQSAKKKSKYY